MSSSVTINGNEVMLLQNDPAYQLPYGAKTLIGDQQITVYSETLDITELQKSH